MAFLPLSQPRLVAKQQPRSRLFADDLGSSIVSAVVNNADIDKSRIQFYVWFFGSSGAAGIGRDAFPRLYNNYKLIQGFKGMPTKGGETLGVSPLCGYPEDLSRADLMQIINNKLSIEQIVQKFPVQGNFLAAKGYITYEAFKQGNKGANPLAVRAVFDSFNTSNDVSNPETAQQKINMYKEDLDTLNGELLKSKLIGSSSIFVLIFLLGFADVVAFGHAKDGWFPEWPGFVSGPFSFIQDLQQIPDYWVS